MRAQTERSYADGRIVNVAVEAQVDDEELALRSIYLRRATMGLGVSLRGRSQLLFQLEKQPTIDGEPPATVDSPAPPVSDPASPSPREVRARKKAALAFYFTVQASLIFWVAWNIEHQSFGIAAVCYLIFHLLLGANRKL